MVTQNNLPIDSSNPRKRVFRFRGCLLAIIAIPVLYYLSFFIFRGSIPSDPQLIAHRGGPAYQPENTLAAFQNSIDLGVDWIEMDVQETKDGFLVVIHDETVERTTNGAGRVGDLTFAEIRSLDAGNGEKVPTFQEVIALAKESGVGILPEAKSPHLYPDIANLMVAELSTSGYTENAIIQSFDPSTLEQIHENDPKIQLCPLYGLWELNLNHPTPAGATKLCPMAEMIILNPWMIKQAHANGREVYVWFGISEHPLIARLILAMGADGLMVDDPVALAKILDR